MQLVVARIGRAHGIKGEVTVEVRTDEPEVRLAPGALLATDPPETGPLTVESSRVHSGRLLLRFAGVPDRTGAEALRNTFLVAEVAPDERPKDAEEFYDHQLIGLKVTTAGGDSVGRITEVAHLPGQDLLVVARPEGEEALIPFVREIVSDVAPSSGQVVITPPPGLLEEDVGPTDGASASGREGS